MVTNKKQLLVISGYIDGKPTGGVTMHVHRLLKQLIEPSIPNYELCDYKKDGLFLQIKKIHRADLMHIHASNPYLKLFYVLVGKMLQTKSIMTVHGRYGCFNAWKNFINKLALKWCDIPILINRESFTDVVKFNRAAAYIPAFIPPIEEEEKLEPEIESKIKSIKADGHPLFVTNASSRAFTDDGKEIYGIGFLVDFFSKHPEYNLVILDPQGQYHKQYDGLLPNNITIINGLHSFCGVIELADVVVRNTPMDGDSFSVKEALCYHKRILVTDAVSRPEGVFLFKYNDAKSFESAIIHALAYDEPIELKEENALPQYSRLYSHYGVSINQGGVKA